MISKMKRSNSAFTLVEIMIVVAIIGLLAALAIPGFVKARKQSQGRRIINDARQMDGAIDQWAINTGQQDGTVIVDPAGSNVPAISTYLKTAWETTDLLNNSYSFGNIGFQQVQISTATKNALSGVNIDWGSY